MSMSVTKNKQKTVKAMMMGVTLTSPTRAGTKHVLGENCVRTIAVVMM